MTESQKHTVGFDVARAFAQLAVVINHICQYSSRYGLGNFSTKFGDTVVSIVSFIHIPTFMLISGILTSLTISRIERLNDYFRFEKKRFCRLMLPFCSVSILHLVIKMFSPPDVQSKGITALVNTVIAPGGGEAGHLWFLYCLMSIFLIWPLLSRLMSGRMSITVLSGLMILAVLPIGWPVVESGAYLFGLKAFFWFIPMFTLGYWYGTRQKNVYKGTLKGIIVSAGILTGSLLVYFFIAWPENSLSLCIRNMVCMVGSVSASFFVLWVSCFITEHSSILTKYLGIAGFYSYDIYLLHVALVGHPLCFIMSKLRIGTAITYVLFVTLILATMIIPIGIGWLIRRIPLLAFFVLGVPLPARGNKQNN